ncbi:MAG: hypothetical protein LBI18_10595 [Planctomycetaceae bacterium]|jgi:hypothetical protein|nr:hypothetical protein [Planctomycetaceae bacterium]
MNIFDHWIFQLAGVYSDALHWKDAVGMEHFMLRFDFVGGKQSIELEQSEYDSYVARLEVGTQVRILGKVLQSNGKPRLKIQQTQIKGIDQGFKDLSPSELRAGSIFRGIGEVLQRRMFNPKIGDPRYEVAVKTMGGTVVLNCTPERYSELADKGCYMFEGQFVTDLNRNFDSGKVSYQSVLAYQLAKVIVCDENGEPIKSDIRRGKEAA